MLLIAVPDATGSFEVSERLRLARPITSLTLAPPDISRAGAIFSGTDATATDVQLSAGDQPVAVPATVAHPVTLPAAGAVFSLRYRLDGVSVRTRPSTAGRALAAIGPLSSRLPADLPVVLIVSGPTVLGVDCPLQSALHRVLRRRWRPTLDTGRAAAGRCRPGDRAVRPAGRLTRTVSDAPRTRRR